MTQLETPQPSDSLAKLRIHRSASSKSRPRVRKFVAVLLLLLLMTVVVAVGIYLAPQSEWLKQADFLAPRLDVRVVSVQVETGRAADALVVATGYLESRRQAKIGAKAPGRIQTVDVEEGSRVSAGQILAIVEHADLDASLAAAAATLARANAELGEHEIQIAQNERDYLRATKLREAQTISAGEFDQIKFKYDASVARRLTLQAAVQLADARGREAQQLKENMFVRAPFDGTVISKDAEVGESIMPGGMGEASGRGSVVTIADLEHLEVDTDVKEDYISRILIGQPAQVSVDAVPNKRYEGRVRKVIPMGDRARATIKVKVEIVDVDAQLFPEMSSTVYFLPPTTDDSSKAADIAERRVFCPAEAVRSDGPRQFVWVVDADERTRSVEIVSGDARDDRVEILSGLQGGEDVVARPTEEIQEGSRVRVSR